ncbi:MAG TPA: MerR family transcriptional regulator, partial [bacterium]|nr:MerR family transcriptional regulator [bacterium]
MTSKDKTQPIQKVARLTGLNPHVIRMWEKRYEAVKPERTQTNRRAYTDEDIERLQLLGYLTREGHRIGQVARVSLTELKELVKSLEGEKRSERKASSEPEDLLSA